MFLPILLHLHSWFSGIVNGGSFSADGVDYAAVEKEAVAMLPRRLAIQSKALSAKN